MKNPFDFTLCLNDIPSTEGRVLQKKTKCVCLFVGWFVAGQRSKKDIFVSYTDLWK